MKHRVDYDETRGVLNIRFVGEIKENEYLEISRSIKKLPPEKRMKLVINLSDNNSSLHRQETREMLARGLERVPGSRIAVIGSTPVTRMMAKTFVASLGQPESTGFFKNEKEALRWIRGDSK